jgi:4-carboxymuconolactone decarboxylase
MDYTEMLRRLAIHDPRLAQDRPGPCVPVLDPKTLALVRLGLLIATGGSVPSYGAYADAAVDEGATVAEIVDVLVAAIPVVGLPCVVAAAPRLAMALGYDVEEGLESRSI